MESDLKNAKTMNEIFTVCSKHYNLDVPLGVASKIVVCQGIKTAIKVINAKLKK
jgi:hypothetical protein